MNSTVNNLYIKKKRSDFSLLLMLAFFCFFIFRFSLCSIAQQIQDEKPQISELEILHAQRDYRGIVKSLSSDLENIRNSGKKNDNPTLQSGEAATGSVISVDKTQAIVEVTVNPSGLNISSIEVEYGTTDSYGNTAAAYPIRIGGNVTKTVSVLITGLSAATMYNYRAKVITPSTTYYGANSTFTTLVTYDNKFVEGFEGTIKLSNTEDSYYKVAKFDTESFPPPNWVSFGGIEDIDPTDASGTGGRVGWVPIDVGIAPFPGWMSADWSNQPELGRKIAYVTYEHGGSKYNNNYIATPKFLVPAIGGSVSCVYGNEFGNFADNFQIIVSTTGNTEDDFRNGTILGTNEFARICTGTSGADPCTNEDHAMFWYNYTYSLDAFAGQEIYIAFREFHINNWYDVKANVLDMIELPLQASPPIFDISRFDRRTYQFINQTEIKEYASFLWDFGDGTYSNEINPIHTFSSPGTYSVTLIGNYRGNMETVRQNCIVIEGSSSVLEAEGYQSDIKYTTKGSADVPVLRLDIYNTKTNDALLQTINVALTNTADSDITAVKLYLTDSKVFATDNLIASKTPSTTVSFSSLNLYLAPYKDYYFWIVYDVSADAIAGNILDAKIAINGITADNQTYPASEINPEDEITILPAQITLVSPQNNDVVNSLKPEFSWINPFDVTEQNGAQKSSENLAAPNITYKFYINTSSDFTGISPTAINNSYYYYPTDLIENTVYHWKVTAEDENSLTIASSTNSFTVNSANSAPSQFNLLTPAAESKLSAVPEFSWEVSTDVDPGDEVTYTLYLGKDIESLPNVYVGSSTSFTPSALDDGDVYYWTVIAKDKSLSSQQGNIMMRRFVINGELPVELIKFTGELVEDKVYLFWETATEMNNYGFEVQRKQTIANGFDLTGEWETIGFIQGNGNSNSPKQYEFVDQDYDKEHAFELEYRLKQIDTDGDFEYYEMIVKVNLNLTDINDLSTVPLEFALKQNHPNPFNPSTVIGYSLKERAHVQLIVYDLLGQEVAVLVNQEQSAGYYNVTFNAGYLVSGTYIYKITAGDFSQVRKLLLMK